MLFWYMGKFTGMFQTMPQQRVFWLTTIFDYTKARQNFNYIHEILDSLRNAPRKITKQSVTAERKLLIYAQRNN